ncbi:hypothetical protein NFI96_024329 [Prochilodus magdalenae]|nr:hypothetical protein NFI96_024329 [Prochilodus magdalenae]
MINLVSRSGYEPQLNAINRVPRTGWVYRNVERPESVSDHMYRMAMMALTVQDTSINRERCMKLALVHDLAECIVGDIAPADNVSKAEKHRREKEAMVRITGLLSEDLRKEMYQLWEASEYETQSSSEARLVKELDQLEMILQAHEYEKLEGRPGRLQEFFTSTEGLWLGGVVLEPVPEQTPWTGNQPITWYAHLLMHLPVSSPRSAGASEEFERGESSPYSWSRRVHLGEEHRTELPHKTKLVMTRSQRKGDATAPGFVMV